jgi:hypothetical protein
LSVLLVDPLLFCPAHGFWLLLQLSRESNGSTFTGLVRDYLQWIGKEHAICWLKYKFCWWQLASEQTGLQLRNVHPGYNARIECRSISHPSFAQHWYTPASACSRAYI